MEDNTWYKIEETNLWINYSCLMPWYIRFKMAAKFFFTGDLLFVYPNGKYRLESIRATFKKID